MQQDADAIERFEQLLNDVQRLSPAKQAPETFLQISGFPHWETVCSNILAFFFDPRKEHGLEDLFLRSLLELCAPKFGSGQPKEDLLFDRIVREEETEEGKQIDLMIIAKPFLVGIENKIHARVNNPLEVYCSHLKKKAREEGIPPKNIVRILLSVREERVSGKHGFKPITYEKFFGQILKNLGHHVLESERRSLTFLIDFMKTITNEQKKTEIDLQLRNFLKQDGREATSVQFYARLTKFAKLLRSRIRSVDEKVRVPPNCKRRFLWCSLNGDGSEENVYDSLNFEHSLSDRTVVTVQVSISPDGWEVCHWTKPEKTGNWRKSKGIPDTARFSFDDREEQVAEACTKLLRAVARLP